MKRIIMVMLVLAAIQGVNGQEHATNQSNLNTETASDSLQLARGPYQWSIAFGLEQDIGKIALARRFRSRPIFAPKLYGTPSIEIGQFSDVNAEYDIEDQVWFASNQTNMQWSYVSGQYVLALPRRHISISLFTGFGLTWYSESTDSTYEDFTDYTGSNSYYNTGLDKFSRVGLISQIGLRASILHVGASFELGIVPVRSGYTRYMQTRFLFEADNEDRWAWLIALTTVSALFLIALTFFPLPIL